MKLGSNRKSIGMGAGYREFSYDNKRVREGFKKKCGILNTFGLNPPPTTSVENIKKNVKV